MKDNNTIKLTSLGLLPKPEIKIVKCGEAEVEVATFIPYEDVFDAIQWSVGYIADERPFVSEPVRQLILDFAILKYYTNLDISFINEEARVSDIYADYDLIKRVGILSQVKEIINAEQLAFFENGVDKIVHSVTQYKNSAAGIIDILAKNADEDVNTMQRMMDAVQDTEELNAVGNLIKFAKTIKPEEPAEE